VSTVCASGCWRSLLHACKRLCCKPVLLPQLVDCCCIIFNAVACSLRQYHCYSIRVAVSSTLLQYHFCQAEPRAEASTFAWLHAPPGFCGAADLLAALPRAAGSSPWPAGVGAESSGERRRITFESVRSQAPSKTRARECEDDRAQRKGPVPRARARESQRGGAPPIGRRTWSWSWCLAG